ncbi:MAG TPA: nucleotide exchange factor GrpE [Chloroflexota bacterium]|jgi:molecular chaperone GrpE
MVEDTETGDTRGEAETAAATREGADSRRRWHRRGAQNDGDSHASEETHAAEGDDVAASLSQEQLALVERLVGERLTQEQAKTEEANVRWQRTQADFANYKRRNEQERDQQGKFATLLLVSELLPVLDDLDRALATMPESVQGLPWTDGLLLVDRILRATLEKQGLRQIEAVGARFDPMLHEAIIQEESSDFADDEVVAELRRGYMLHDKVVRPTLVKVAKHVASTE